MKTPLLNTPSLFVVEGPDACGKTTLSLELAASLGGVYWHLTCTDTLAKAMHDYQINSIENIKANLKLGRHVVMDRHWPSEHCYGQHFRRDTMVDVWPICAELAKLKPTFIFCMDPNGAVSAADRHEEHLDPDHPYKREDYMAVYNNYEEVIGMLDDDDHSHVIVRPFQDTLDMMELQTFIGQLKGFKAEHLEFLLATEGAQS